MHLITAKIDKKKKSLCIFVVAQNNIVNMRKIMSVVTIYRSFKQCNEKKVITIKIIETKCRLR